MCMFDVRMPSGWCGVGAPHGSPAGMRWTRALGSSPRLTPSTSSYVEPEYTGRNDTAGSTRVGIYTSRSRGASPLQYVSFYPVLRITLVIGPSSFYIVFFLFMGYPYAAWTGFCLRVWGNWETWVLASGGSFFSIFAWLEFGVGVGVWELDGTGWDGIFVGVKWTAFTPGRRKRAGVVGQWIGQGGICFPEKRTAMLGRSERRGGDGLGWDGKGEYI